MQVTSPSCKLQALVTSYKPKLQVTSPAAKPRRNHGEHFFSRPSQYCFECFILLQVTSPKLQALRRNRGETTAKPWRNCGKTSYKPQLQVTSPSYKLQAKVTSYKPCGKTAVKLRRNHGETAAKPWGNRGETAAKKFFSRRSQYCFKCFILLQ